MTVRNDIMELDYEMILRNYITKFYYGMIVRNRITPMTTTTSRQMCSARRHRLLHPNHFDATHHPSEPRDLPDSPEDPPGVCPGNPPSQLVMYTVEIMHSFKRPGEGPPHGGNQVPIRPPAQDGAYTLDLHIHICT